MTRLRISLLLLATVALVAFGVPAFADTATSTLPPELTAPAAPEANLCPEAPDRVELAAPAWEVIICSCKLCGQHPNVECQIGPGDGYSILCADYYRINC